MKYSGKHELISGFWYPVSVDASNYQDAIRKLYIGQRKSYGIVKDIKGRFKREV